MLLFSLALIARGHDHGSTVSVGWHGELEAASLLGLPTFPQRVTQPEAAPDRPPLHLEETHASWRAPRIALEDPPVALLEAAQPEEATPDMPPAQLRVRSAALSPDDPRKYVVSVLIAVPVFLLVRHLLHLVVVEGFGARTAAQALATADAPQVDAWARLVANAPIPFRFLSAVGMLAVLVLDFSWETNRHMYLLQENRLTLVMLCLYLLVGLFTTIHLRGSKRGPLAEKRSLLTANSEMIAMVYPLSVVAAVLFWLYEWKYVPAADRPGLGFTACPHGLNAVIAVADAFAIGQPIFLGDVLLPVSVTLAYVFQTMTYYHWLEGTAEINALHRVLAWRDRPDEAAVVAGSVAFLVLPAAFGLFYAIAKCRAPSSLYVLKESAPPRGSVSSGPAGAEDSVGSPERSGRRKQTIRWEDRDD